MLGRPSPRGGRARIPQPWCGRGWFGARGRGAIERAPDGFERPRLPVGARVASRDTACSRQIRTRCAVGGLKRGQNRARASPRPRCRWLSRRGAQRRALRAQRWWGTCPTRLTTAPIPDPANDTTFGHPQENAPTPGAAASGGRQCGGAELARARRTSWRVTGDTSAARAARRGGDLANGA